MNPGHLGHTVYGITPSLSCLTHDVSCCGYRMHMTRPLGSTLTMLTVLTVLRPAEAFSASIAQSVTHLTSAWQNIFATTASVLNNDRTSSHVSVNGNHISWLSQSNRQWKLHFQRLAPGENGAATNCWTLSGLHPHVDIVMDMACVPVKSVSEGLTWQRCPSTVGRLPFAAVALAQYSPASNTHELHMVTLGADDNEQTQALFHKSLLQSCSPIRHIMIDIKHSVVSVFCQSGEVWQSTDPLSRGWSRVKPPKVLRNGVLFHTVLSSVDHRHHHNTGFVAVSNDLSHISIFYARLGIWSAPMQLPCQKPFRTLSSVETGRDVYLLSCVSVDGSVLMTIEVLLADPRNIKITKMNVISLPAPRHSMVHHAMSCAPIACHVDMYKYVMLMENGKVIIGCSSTGTLWAVSPFKLDISRHRRLHCTHQHLIVDGHPHGVVLYDLGSSHPRPKEWRQELTKLTRWMNQGSNPIIQSFRDRQTLLQSSGTTATLGKENADEGNNNNDRPSDTSYFDGDSEEDDEDEYMMLESSEESDTDEEDNEN